MRAAIYCRISADREGSGLGVDRQREDCEKLASDLGWNVIEVFSDNDISAYSGKHRPGYEAMLVALKAGRADAVIAWHTDRLHRSPTELETFITVCTEHSTVVRTVQAGELDLSSPAGQMTARIVGAVARHEIDHARKRMVRAHEQAAAAGKWRAHRRVFGYVKGGTAEVPVEADAIRKAVEQLLAGVSLRQVAREWNEAGLETTGSAAKFDASAVRDIVGNPRYAGLQSYRGRVIGKGEWSPIIAEEDHLAIKALLADPSRARKLSYERRHQGSGVYICGKCPESKQQPMTMTQTADGVKHYRCTVSTHLSRQGIGLDAFVDQLVIGRLSQPDAALVLDTPDIDLPSVQIQRDGFQARLDQLTDMFTEGTIDGPQLQRGTETLKQKIDGLDKQLVMARMVSPLADLILAGDKLAERWTELSADVRGKVISALMAVTVLPSPRGRRRFDPDFVKVDWKV